MLFHKFNSQEERRNYGGSGFIEIQYCRLKTTLSIDEIISLDSIKNWKDESLYIHGDSFDKFLLYYGDIFCDGIYGNGESGVIDEYGINYYSGEQVLRIIEKIRRDKPPEYDVLLNWLQSGGEYTGVYILGV